VTAITVANTDWAIISDIKDALTNATISDVAVFKTVTATTSAPQFEQAQYKGTYPIACVRFVGTNEGEMPDDERWGAVRVELYIATKADPAVDESARVQEALRLVNAAKNAVEADPPDDATYWGPDGDWQNELTWDSPELETSEPWITATVPLAVGYALSSSTSH
jgi:hypothetical protein